MRSAAAAAIVFVVAGGAWSIYMHVQPPKPGTTFAAPAGGFSSAGAMRVPQTITGPVIAKPADTQAKTAKSVPVAPTVHHRARAALASKTQGKRAVAATQ